MLKDNYKDLSDNGVAGDWCFFNDDTEMMLIVPGEDGGHWAHLYLSTEQKINDKTPEWIWNGNREAPTLLPSPRHGHSIKSYNKDGVIWHGYLTDGKLVKA